MIGRPGVPGAGGAAECGGLRRACAPRRRRAGIERLSDWIREAPAADPPRPRPGGGQGRATWDPRGRWSLLGLLGLAAAILLAVTAAGAASLAASSAGKRRTGAADRGAAGGVQDGERPRPHRRTSGSSSRGEWLRRGDLRQAVRALYLAMLVELHRRRRIDYDRAGRTGTTSGTSRADRRAAGPPGLTIFDLAWYRPAAVLHRPYEEFAAGVRSLADASRGLLVHAWGGARRDAAGGLASARGWRVPRWPGWLVSDLLSRGLPVAPAGGAGPTEPEYLYLSHRHPGREGALPRARGEGHRVERWHSDFTGLPSPGALFVIAPPRTGRLAQRGDSSLNEIEALDRWVARGNSGHHE